LLEAELRKGIHNLNESDDGGYMRPAFLFDLNFKNHKNQLEIIVNHIISIK
jgi:hypothetical protein